MRVGNQSNSDSFVDKLKTRSSTHWEVPVLFLKYFWRLCFAELETVKIYTILQLHSQHTLDTAIGLCCSCLSAFMIKNTQVLVVRFQVFPHFHFRLWVLSVARGSTLCLPDNFFPQTRYVFALSLQPPSFLSDCLRFFLGSISQLPALCSHWQRGS